MKDRKEEGRRRVEKEKAGIFVNKKTLDDFRALIQKKYGHYRKGFLSYEIEQAMVHWIAMHTEAQSKIRVSNPKPVVSLVFSEVKDYLLRKWYHELKTGQHIPLIHLKRAIMVTRGSDKRTVKKWLRAFEEMELIKPITSAVWEIL